MGNLLLRAPWRLD